jgi:hypothetical protein
MSEAPVQVKAPWTVVIASGLTDKHVRVALILAVVIWSAFAGKDLNFDQLSYHFYLGYNLLDDRLLKDFMAASAQSYLNPLAYLPFYSMVVSGWPSILVASVLASFHSLNVLLAYSITRDCLPANQSMRAPLSFIGGLLAFLSPVFLLEAGSSFADVTSAVPLMGAGLLALREPRSAQRWWRESALWCGCLAGCAAGLKLSNAVFLPAIVLAALLMQGNVRQAVRAIVLLGTGAVAGLVVSHGYWSWKLWDTFQNPLFPFFNSAFASPDFPVTGGGRHERFLPQNIADWLTLPFRMVQLRSGVYIESSSPDLRFAAVAFALMATLLLGARRLRSEVAGLLGNRVVALTVMFVCSYVLWLATSGNGRYGLFVSILCGPLLVLLTTTLARRRLPIAVTALLIIVLLQIIHIQNGQARWIAGTWTPNWYDIVVPPELQEVPYLYVSVGGNANSYLFPYLHRQSAFTNPIGQVGVDLEGPGGSRLTALLNQYSGRTRVLALAAGDEPESIDQWNLNVGALISRLGYGVDTQRCSTITASGSAWDAGMNFDGAQPDRRQFRTCMLVRRPFVEDNERRSSAELFNQIAAWCPKLFKPAYAVVEKSPTTWFATYPITDTRVSLADGRLLLSQAGANVDVFLGTVEGWREGKRPDCAKLPARLRSKYPIK